MYCSSTESVFPVRKHVNVDVNVHPVHCVSTLSNANFILWHVGRQLFVQELSSAPRLLSPYCCAPGHPSPSLTITLPEWSRPGDSTQSEVVQETQNVAVTAPATVESSELPVTEVSICLVQSLVRMIYARDQNFFSGRRAFDRGAVTDT